VPRGRLWPSAYYRALLCPRQVLVLLVGAADSGPLFTTGRGPSLAIFDTDQRSVYSMADKKGIYPVSKIEAISILLADSDSDSDSDSSGSDADSGDMPDRFDALMARQNFRPISSGIAQCDVCKHWSGWAYRVQGGSAVLCRNCVEASAPCRRV
jgi:hypothetical protein